MPFCGNILPAACTVARTASAQAYPPSEEEAAAFAGGRDCAPATNSAFDELIHGSSAAGGGRKRKGGGAGGLLTRAAHFTPQQVAERRAAWAAAQATPAVAAIAAARAKLPIAPHRCLNRPLPLRSCPLACCLACHVLQDWAAATSSRLAGMMAVLVLAVRGAIVAVHFPDVVDHHDSGAHAILPEEQSPHQGTGKCM